MAYRTRPRFQARIERRDKARETLPAPKPEGRWEPGQVLDALNELHNAPQPKFFAGEQSGRRVGR